MNRFKAMVTIAALCVMAAAGTVVWAQDADRDSCVDACQQAKARCVTTCGTHDNPMECEEDCQVTAEACTRQCR
jgi:hypothetical protein